MNQLPIFVTLKNQKVILVGDGEASDAKRRLIERAGGLCVGPADPEARIAFVAIEDKAEAEEISAQLKARKLLVNVVDQPALCDFTTPAIIDRDPLLVAIGTGGASAGLAKALRQRLETLLPDSLGPLAQGLLSARQAIRAKWPDPVQRRKAIDSALDSGGALDPLSDHAPDALAEWLNERGFSPTESLITLRLASNDPDDLTLRQARLLGQADHIYHDGSVPSVLLDRARADAVRHVGAPVSPLPSGLILHIIMTSNMLNGTV